MPRIKNFWLRWVAGMLFLVSIVAIIAVLVGLYYWLLASAGAAAILMPLVIIFLVFGWSLGQCFAPPNR